MEAHIIAHLILPAVLVIQSLALVGLLRYARESR